MYSPMCHTRRKGNWLIDWCQHMHITLKLANCMCSIRQGKWRQGERYKVYWESMVMGDQCMDTDPFWVGCPYWWLAPESGIMLNHACRWCHSGQTENQSTEISCPATMMSLRNAILRVPATDASSPVWTNQLKKICRCGNDACFEHVWRHALKVFILVLCPDPFLTIH